MQPDDTIKHAHQKTNMIKKVCKWTKLTNQHNENETAQEMNLLYAITPDWDS